MWYSPRQAIPMKRARLPILSAVALLTPFLSPTPTLSQPPPPSPRIRLAYFVPNDRRPAPDHERKIRLLISLVADLYLQDLRSAKHATTGLHFDPDDARPTVHLLRGDRPAAHYNNAPAYDADEQWRRLLPEIRDKLGEPRKQITVVFAETYDDGPAEHLFPGTIARGAYLSADGGLAVFSAHVLRDQFCAQTRDAHLKLMTDDTPIPGRKAWGHRPNSPRRAFVEAGLGAVAHELAHALGLPHDRRDDQRDLMGNGFRNVRANFNIGPAPKVTFSPENRLLLMSSRYLAKDLNPADTTPPRLELSDARKVNGAWSVNVKATDENGLRAIVFVDRTAATLIAGRPLTGKTAEFRQPLPTANASANHLDLQIILTDHGGNHLRRPPRLTPTRN